ncbi:hypothetical protein HBB16_06835 [Pseudonocardia sp. MCCB 268]|nr:hypothetical protein [Pseudonocardia cytotoxica]
MTVGQAAPGGHGGPASSVLQCVMGPRDRCSCTWREVQKAYRTQSVDIHDKHIEVIVRQMLRR